MLHSFVAQSGVLTRVASLAFAMSAFLPMRASAEQIRVKVLNAKNAKPFNHVNLTIGTAGPQTSTFHIETDRTGLDWLTQFRMARSSSTRRVIKLIADLLCNNSNRSHLTRSPKRELPLQTLAEKRRTSPLRAN